MCSMEKALSDSAAAAADTRVRFKIGDRVLCGGDYYDQPGVIVSEDTNLHGARLLIVKLDGYDDYYDDYTPCFYQHELTLEPVKPEPVKEEIAETPRKTRSPGVARLNKAVVVAELGSFSNPALAALTKAVLDSGWSGPRVTDVPAKPTPKPKLGGNPLSLRTRKKILKRKRKASREY